MFFPFCYFISKKQQGQQNFDNNMYTKILSHKNKFKVIDKPKILIYTYTGKNKYALLAQLDRALVYGTKGWGFELLTAHQQKQSKMGCFFCAVHRVFLTPCPLFSLVCSRFGYKHTLGVCLLNASRPRHTIFYLVTLFGGCFYLRGIFI